MKIISKIRSEFPNFAQAFSANTVASRIDSEAVSAADDHSSDLGLVQPALQGIGVTITGTSGGDVVSLTRSPPGQPQVTAFSDTIYGLAGNDKIDGSLGADNLVGGAGLDTYTVDDINDIVTELANEGADKVIAKVSYSLSDNVEHLTLWNGNSNLNGSGNALANKLTGNSGNNVLSGLSGKDTILGGDGNDTIIGGAGGDKLTGGQGSDVFRFDTVVVETSDKDLVADFVSGVDKIEISVAAFAKLSNFGLGMLSTNELVIGPAATDERDRLIYDPAKGTLYYDHDGSKHAGNSAIAIAIFAGQPPLVASDIILV